MVFCINCGSEAPYEAKFCYKCGNVIKGEKKEIKPSFNNNNEYIQEEKIHDIESEVEIKYASIGIRFVAIFIDGIIINIIVFLLALLISIPLLNQPEYADLIIFTVNITVLLLYFTVLEGPFSNGQTIGKRATSIRVISKNGNERITYTQSFIRTILRIIDGIPFIIPYLLGAIIIHSSDKNQRIGDMAASSIVVKD